MNWIMLVVIVPSLAFTLTRLPKLKERRNWRIAIAGALLVTSFTLMIPAIYIWVDAGRHNATDLMIKLALFVSLNVVGAELARTNLDATTARRLVGLPGLAALGVFTLVCAGLLVMALPHAATSSPALEQYLDVPVVVAYNCVASLYPASIRYFLTRPLLRTVRSSSASRNRRLNAMLALAGFGVSLLGAALLPFTATNPVTYRMTQGVCSFAALLVIAGLVLAWIEKRDIGAVTQSSLRT
jgi:hypothetical protein